MRGMRRREWWALAAAALPFVACGRQPPAVDLVHARDRLVEARAASLDRAAVVEALGRPVRINDVVRRTLPSGPPSRLVFRLALPRGARFVFTCAIAPEFQDRPGVEFVVKARKDGRESILFSKLLDPLSHPEHRGWVTGDVDLARFAGSDVELSLETRGFDPAGDPGQAFWGTPAVTAASPDAPLVVVYLVDTLRADHTGPYGYARDTTPHLDAFAKDAVVFDQAVVHASWTKPSVASILTSLLPAQHRAVQLRDPLDPAHVTLAQMLQARGYATGAAIANSVIYGAESSFDRGFDYFAGLHGEGDRPSKLVGADVVVDAALSWLEARRGFPTFLYVHTMDPHVPYAPPPPFDRKYEPHPTEGHPAQDPRSDYKEPLDRERMIAQYDGDVAYGDQEFGRFVRGLKERGLYDRALVVFLADHGEEFLDHGKWLHGRSVFDELIRIPLVVKLPGRRDAGRRVALQVQAVDVLPTVLESQGLPVPAPPAIAGRPLQPLLAGKEDRRPAISEISHRGFVAHGVRTEADKYIHRFGPETDELYFDLVKDPKEQTSVLESQPSRVRFLKGQAEAAMSTNPFRYVIRVGGSSQYALTLDTDGWLEGVEATGLGPSERSLLRENGRKLELLLRPRPAEPREIAFALRPRGAPVTLQGTRDGRPLRPGDVAYAESGRSAPAFPFRLPDIEQENEHEHERGLNLFAAPKSSAAGVHVWLALAPGRKLMELDAETRERLKALGYLGPN
jgi:arylsulfatase A-like enzyme